MWKSIEFNNPAPQDERPSIEPEETNEDSTNNYLNRLSEIYKTKGPSRSRYESLLAAPPSREQYKPNMLTKIAGMLGGASVGMRDPAAGLELHRDIRERPYNVAYDEYLKRIEMTRKGSELERLAQEDEAENLIRAANAGLGYQKFVRGAAQKDTALDIQQQNANRMGKFTDSTIDYRQGMLGLGNRRADTAAAAQAANERLGGQRIDLTKRGQDLTTDYRNRMATVAEQNATTARARADAYITKTISGGTNKPPSPNAYLTAKAAALSDMYIDPIARKFIKRTPEGYYEIDTDQERKPGYQTFLEMLAEKTKGVLGGKY
jgi:hypothetical protein